MAHSLVPNNVYVITCVASGTVLDLVDGSSANGTACHSDTDHSGDICGFSEQWLVTEVSGHGDCCFTLRNLRSGTYLDLDNGKKLNGTKIQGWAKASAQYEKDQQWKIAPVGGDAFTVQNVAGGTYMDIKDRDLQPGGVIHAWERKDTPTQLWKFKRVSRAGHEINALLRNNPHIQQVFKSYSADGLYINIPKSVRDDIYNNTKLRNIQWREQIFDCDDFAFVAKAEVAKWGNNYLHAVGFAILFGVMFGTNDRGAGHAYNWYLGDNLDKIVFFDPQNGSQQDDIWYKAHFGVY